jgi:hypothetical protein
MNCEAGMLEAEFAAVFILASRGIWLSDSDGRLCSAPL